MEVFKLLQKKWVPKEKLTNQLTNSVKMAHLPLGVFEDYLSSKPLMKQAAYCFPSKLMGLFQNKNPDVDSRLTFTKSHYLHKTLF